MATELKNPTFIHLRAHSAYSLAEGALHIKQMAVLAKEAGMPALAITDSGNLFGALEFSEALADKGIQPIIGCSLRAETHAAAADATAKTQPHPKKLPPLVLLAKDETGYRNLMKLSSRAYLQTPESELPHVTWEMLEGLSA
ncbi:MAG: PHP domain-containing protein, partial [Aestuariivirga sp.]